MIGKISHNKEKRVVHKLEMSYTVWNNNFAHLSNSNKKLIDSYLTATR